MVTKNLIPLHHLNLISKLSFNDDLAFAKKYNININDKKLKSLKPMVWGKMFAFFLNLMGQNNECLHRFKIANNKLIKDFRKFVQFNDESDWDIEAFGDPYFKQPITIMKSLQQTYGYNKWAARLKVKLPRTPINLCVLSSDNVKQMVKSMVNPNKYTLKELLGEQYIRDINMIAIEIDNHSFDLTKHENIKLLNAWKEQIANKIKNYDYRGNINFTSNRSVYLVYTFDRPLKIEEAKALQQFLHFRLYNETGLIADKENLSVSKLVHIPLSVHKSAYMESIITPFIWENTLINTEQMLIDSDLYVRQYKWQFNTYWNKEQKDVNTINVMLASKNEIDSANFITHKINPTTVNNVNNYNEINYYKMLNNALTTEDLVSKNLELIFNKDVNGIRQFLNINNPSRNLNFIDTFKIVLQELGNKMHLFFENQTYRKGLRSQIKREKHPSMQLNSIHNQFSEAEIDYVYHHNDFPSGTIIDLVMWIGNFASEDKSYIAARQEVIYFLANVLNITITRNEKKTANKQILQDRLNFNQENYEKTINSLLSLIKKLYAKNRNKNINNCSELEDLTVLTKLLITDMCRFVKEDVALDKNVHEIQFLRTSQFLLEKLKSTNIKNDAKLSRLLNILLLTKVITRIDTYEKIDLNIRQHINDRRKNLPYVFTLTDFNKKVLFKNKVITYKEYVKYRIHALFKQEKTTKPLSKWTQIDKMSFNFSIPRVSMYIPNTNIVKNTIQQNHPFFKDYIVPDDLVFLTKYFFKSRRC